MSASSARPNLAQAQNLMKPRHTLPASPRSRQVAREHVLRLLGNGASGPAIEIDAPSSVQKPMLIFRRGYVPAQRRRNLTRRDGTIEGGEHVVADAELQ